MIKVHELKKTFGRLNAVDNLSFQVEPGEVLGFLGPNGAGKSTTMKMLTGFLTPDRGKVEIFGLDVNEDPINAQKRLGYLPEGAPAYGDMTVLSFLRFVGQARGMFGAELDRQIDDVIKKVSLESVVGQRVETLSKGYKRRVGLAQAVMHDPDVLILDEPTDGLDPNQKHQVRTLIKNLSKEKIVIISTHVLEEVHAVCTRAMIIASGKIVADGKPEELASLSERHNVVVLEMESQTEALDALQRLDGVHHVESLDSGKRFEIYPVAGVNLVKPITLLASEENWSVSLINLEPGRLEDVFRKVTEEVA